VRLVNAATVIIALLLSFAVSAPEFTDMMAGPGTVRFLVPSTNVSPQSAAPTNATTERWIEPTPRPLPRIGHAIAYDPVSGRTNMFGGLTVGGLSNETWTYNAATKLWRRWTTTQPPAARQGHAMAFDPGTGLVVLFGGRTETGLTNETWVLDPSSVTWTRRAPSVAPSPRERHEMAYDARSGRIVLFGGWTGDNNGETWLYDVRNDWWTQVNPATSPSPRHDHAMASAAGQVVLFGGFVGGAVNQSLSNETWSFDVPTSAWINLTVPASPSPRERHAMAYDNRAGFIVLFGGSTSDGLNGETWRFELASDIWAPVAASTGPSPRDDHAMTYDERLGSVVMMGGQTLLRPSDEVWSLRGADTAWTNSLPIPSPRSGHNTVHAPEISRSILFGGSWSNETWSYDVVSNEWTLLAPRPSPSGRGFFAMAYDSKLGRLVLFGGASLNVPPYDNNETWSYDPSSNVWTNLTASGGPGRREGHAMAYDARAGLFVMFGGYVWGEPQNNETWSYDLANNTWTNMSPPSPPSGRDGHVMGYDSRMGRVILFGGRTATGNSAETWAYDLVANTWTKLTPTVAPPPTWGSSMVFDSGSNRFVRFGGDRPLSPSLNNETWFFYAQNDTWIEAAPSIVPPRRAAHALSYDSRANVTVLFGGFTENLYADDVWWYGSFSPPSSPMMPQAIPGDGRAVLTWEPPAATGGASITGYRVYRGTSSGSVSVVAELDNVLGYNDTGLANGETYRYQVAAVNAVGEGPRSVEVTVVPSAPTDSLYAFLLVGITGVAAILASVGLLVARRRRHEKAGPPPRMKE